MRRQGLVGASGGGARMDLGSLASRPSQPLVHPPGIGLPEWADEPRTSVGERSFGAGPKPNQRAEVKRIVCLGSAMSTSSDGLSPDVTKVRFLSTARTAPPAAERTSPCGSR